MAGTTSFLLRLSFSTPIPISIPPVSFPLSNPQPPIFHRRSISATLHSSPSPLLQTLDPDNSSPSAADDKTGLLYKKDSGKVILKGMRYSELEKWASSHGYRPGQTLMLWKRLYGNNTWAHSIEELEGLNKDFKKMLGELAEFKALSVKDIRTASDGTRKEVADFI